MRATRSKENTVYIFQYLPMKKVPNFCQATKQENYNTYQEDAISGRTAKVAFRLRRSVCLRDLLTSRARPLGRIVYYIR